MADAYDEAKRLGEVLRRARVLARRSQADVATALGYHQSKISRLEQGKGTEDSQVLRAVARELGIPLASVGLADVPDARNLEPETDDMHRRNFLAASLATLVVPAAPSHAGSGALVQALLPGPIPPSQDGDRDLFKLGEHISEVRQLFYACEYNRLEGTLPSLITGLRNAAAGSDEAAGLLATAYQTSASLLLKRGDHGNAWLAVGRAMAEAERSGDPVVLASSVRVHTHLLARERHTPQAITLVRHTADQLTGAYDQRSPRYLAALGLLLLRGVTAASSGGDRSATRDFLTEAKEVARYVALDHPDAWANFSPTNVSLHEVSAAVAFGDAGLALETARPLMRRHIPAPERRSALWVETARAYSQQGRLADGYQALRIAESCAAQDIRRPAIRELVADMAARDRRRTLPELHHFSRQLGVPA
ncbi:MULTISPECIES: helix-turn-helix domain-containing protein [Streptomyces]|uniref:helix-turn-helix domain-containing protein n=1 Tax=Streptomyces TaxID=1883 RepID=UPI00103B11C8|nr:MULTISPECIES: helix-turn-helix transcriptional regulator [Streptomyces]MBT3072826.1 helix-turn-helix transcriptional regulator [Streptomyces sp. COG21]MBT3089888.1 helix-turn-helix transcriptional regulator [Streptomyces sp. CYG21]MBT3097628.1 helix-turn-helix transcriptional regulator [Streptomyces sp. CBG30]MBT3102823.1 helix-turn-helix transcriptional regulator [Streptomyces sp. COG19]MBT3112936.1 helix-turn-helix transcriptional regulator [Streptomyces sp. CYG20]